LNGALRRDLADLPVRLPLSPSDLKGSIHEHQNGSKNKFFAAPEV